MAARAARGRTFTKKNVNYTWSTLIIPPTNLASNTKLLLGFFFLATAFEETVVRVRGVLSISSDQTAAVEAQQGALGMIRTTDRARAAGAGSIPGPITDGDDDGWFVWNPWSQRLVSGAGAPSSNVYQIDSKAQRIVREGQELAVMVESGGIADSDGAVLTLVLRALSRFRS